jgi:protein-S-isoprenylcysteine O-methyltransferase Ste14
MDLILRILIIVSFGWLSILMLLFGRRGGGKILGKPPIAVPLFILAKICLVPSLILLFVAAIRGPGNPSFLAAIAFLILWLAGLFLLTLAFFSLNTNLRVGLPNEETGLVTSGVYAFSRNPIYLALFFLLSASLIYAFSWISLACASITLILHHQIALSEEEYLAGRFPEFKEYRCQVRRYL